MLRSVESWLEDNFPYKEIRVHGIITEITHDIEDGKIVKQTTKINDITQEVESESTEIVGAVSDFGLQVIEVPDTIASRMNPIDGNNELIGTPEEIQSLLEAGKRCSKALDKLNQELRQAVSLIPNATVSEMFL